MILTTLVAAVVLGILAQILAERFQLPAILPLLAFGILCGPAGLAFFEPTALGEVLEVLVHLGVAVILFEGGLSLDPRRLIQVGAPVRNLLTVGVVVTWAGSALAAHELLGMAWSTAVLFGAIMTVTGPTVVVPLLRHMIAPRPVKTVLLSEGLIIDPIGAVLAYLVLQWIERAGVPLRELAGEMLAVAATGAVLGFVAGAMAKLVIRSRMVSGELRNLTILALLMVCYLMAEGQAAQSGILAAVVMGFTMSAAETPDLTSVRAFKGQLTTLVISVLFVLLAGRLEPSAMVGLGWSGVWVVALLILVVRPVAVFASVMPGQLSWRDRVLLALTAPRGIVAAAVASLAAHQLAGLEVAGAEQVEGLVYLGIIGTGVFSTGAALIVPRLLGYTTDPSRRRTVLVGANALTEVLAGLLHGEDRQVVVVDATPWRLDRFRNAGYGTVCGDARDSITFEEAGVQRDTTVVAATTNDELNLLVAELVHDEFGVEHPVVALQRPPEEFGRLSRTWMDLLGDRGFDVPRWIRQMENGKAAVLMVEEGDDEVVALIREVEREHPRGVLRLVTWAEGSPSFEVGDGRMTGGRFALLVASGRPAEMLAPLAAEPEASSEPGEGEPAAPGSSAGAPDAA